MQRTEFEKWGTIGDDKFQAGIDLKDVYMDIEEKVDEIDETQTIRMSLKDAKELRKSKE